MKCFRHPLAIAGVTLLSLSLPLPVRAQQPKVVSTRDATQYVGRTATVCGDVSAAKFSVRTGGAPTFLDLDGQHPNQMFTVLIWGIDRPKFPIPPDSAFANKRICVTGLVTDFKGKPEIVVHDPSEIRLADARK